MIYLKNHHGFTLIHSKNDKYKTSEPLIRIIKQICQKELFSYESRITLTKQTLDIKTKIPIYIHPKLLLMPTKSPKNYDCVWINYYEIYDYKYLNQQIIVTFHNLEQLRLDASLTTFKGILLKAKKVDEYFKRRSCENGYFR